MPRRRPGRIRRRAVVVGGGPAGLEAARVLGERGHHIVLFEAARRGSVAKFCSAPRRVGGKISRCR